MPEKSVSVDAVIAIYKEKLADANHKNVMLQASIIKLEDEIEELKNNASEDSE